MIHICCFLIHKSFWFSLCGSMHRQREEINVYSDKQLTSAQVQSPFSPSYTRLTIDVEEDEFPLCIVTHRRTGRYHIHKVLKFSCNIKDEWLIKSYIIIFEYECEKYMKSELLLKIQFFFWQTLGSKYVREPDKQAYYMVTLQTGSCQILPVSCVLSHSAWMLSLM